MLTHSIRRRFWRYAKRNSHGYLVWSGTKSTAGYGQLRYARRRLLSAHRIAFEIHHGEPPPKHVCHRCDRPACVDKRCLFSGTHHENMLDAAAKGRMARGERQNYAKLTKKDVLEIRQAAPFLLQKTLANAYGISQPTVSGIVACKSWTWLD